MLACRRGIERGLHDDAGERKSRRRTAAWTLLPRRCDWHSVAQMRQRTGSAMGIQRQAAHDAGSSGLCQSLHIVLTLAVCGDDRLNALDARRAFGHLVARLSLCQQVRRRLKPAGR